MQFRLKSTPSPHLQLSLRGPPLISGLIHMRLSFCIFSIVITRNRMIAEKHKTASVPLLLSVQQNGKSFSLLTSRSADVAYATTLSNFLGFFCMWTCGVIRSVQDCMMSCLTDKNPLAARVSILEAWILWVARTCSCPDAFQHACVHMKYCRPPPPPSTPHPALP